MTGEFPAQRASNAENVPFDDVIMERAAFGQFPCHGHCFYIQLTIFDIFSYQLAELAQNCFVINTIVDSIKPVLSKLFLTLSH